MCLLSWSIDNTVTSSSHGGAWKPSPSTANSKAETVRMVVQWDCLVDSSTMLYSRENTEILEEAFSAGKKDALITIGGSIYKVKFRNPMQQVNVVTGFRRPVTRREIVSSNRDKAYKVLGVSNHVYSKSQQLMVPPPLPLPEATKALSPPTFTSLLDSALLSPDGIIPAYRHVRSSVVPFLYSFFHSTRLTSLPHSNDSVYPTRLHV
jgi:hypothetical protein